MGLFNRKKEEVKTYPPDVSYHPENHEVSFDDVMAFMVELEDLDFRKMLNSVSILRQARADVDKVMAVTQEDIDKAKAEAERIQSEARKAEAEKAHAKAMNEEPKFIDKGPGKQRRHKASPKVGA